MLVPLQCMLRSHAQSLTTAIYQWTEKRNNIRNPQPEMHEVKAKKKIKGRERENSRKTLHSANDRRDQGQEEARALRHDQVSF